MPTYLTIRERILAQLAANLTTSLSTSAHAILRWDARGGTKPVHTDVIIVPQDDEVQGESGGHTYAVTTRLMTVVLDAVLFPGAAAGNTDTLKNAWQGALITGAMSDRTLTASSTRLALDVQANTMAAPELVDGAVEAAVIVAIEYQTYSADPTAGPGITASAT